MNFNYLIKKIIKFLKKPLKSLKEFLKEFLYSKGLLTALKKLLLTTSISIACYILSLLLKISLWIFMPIPLALEIFLIENEEHDKFIYFILFFSLGIYFAILNEPIGYLRFLLWLPFIFSYSSKGLRHLYESLKEPFHKFIKKPIYKFINKIYKTIIEFFDAKRYEKLYQQAQEVPIERKTVAFEAIEKRLKELQLHSDQKILNLPEENLSEKNKSLENVLLQQNSEGKITRQNNCTV